MYPLQENFKQLVELTEKAREAYREMIAQIEQEMKEYPPRHATPGVPHVFAHYGHSRTPSGCSVLSFTSSILSEPISENYPYSEPETDKYGNEIPTKSKVKTSVEDDDKDIDDDDDDENDKNIENGYEGDDEGITNESETDPKHAVSNRRHRNSNSFGKSEGSIDNVTPRIVNPDSPTCSENALDENDNEENGNIDSKEDLSFVETNSENDITEEELTEEADTVLDLPNVNKNYMESIYDFNMHEILSQQSSTERTVGENVEEISNHSSKTTHSSKTFGEGSVFSEKKNISKVDIKNSENAALTLKGKSAIDKKSRTLSWVQETQQHHFKEDLENDNEGKEDSDGAKLVDAVA